MNDPMKTNASRRAFFQRAAALSMSGIATPWALNLASMAEASAAEATDYKAIVCVFLYGGNDYANTIVPYDAASYNAYQQLRPSLAYQRSNLMATALKPVAAPIDRYGAAHEYALAPELAPLLPLFDAGKMGVVLNLGTLIQPTSKFEYTKSQRTTATEIILTQRSTIDVAIIFTGRRQFGLGRSHGRSVCSRQWQCHFHLHQRLWQCSLSLWKTSGAVSNDDQRLGSF